MLINPFVFGGAPPAGDLYSLIMADLASAGGGYYFRHAEASGSTMVNEVGTNGSYAPSVSLAQPALYSGGGTSVRIPVVSGGGYGQKTGGSLPNLTQLSILTVVSFTTLSGMHGIISNDDGSSNRGWQWRTNGTDVQWVKIAGGVDTKNISASLAINTPYLIGIDISDSGTPGTSNFLATVNGSTVLSTTIATVNYGTIGEILQIGYTQGGGGLLADAFFSESALIPASIGASRWAAYAAAAGL